jgi:hypothetical protein
MDMDGLHKQLAYDPKTGLFTWKVDKKGHIKKGDIAGTKHNRGYISITLNGKSYLAHRLAMIISGISISSTDQVDHINDNRSDNRLSNLCVATHDQNCQNAKVRKDNLAGLKGVGYDKRIKKWRARIVVDKKQKWLGNFTTPEEAHAAYCKAAEELHGEFQRKV